MSDKKTESINIHISSEKKARVLVLAELENKSLSEMGEHIIDQYLNEKQRQFELMSKAFGNLQNSKNDQN